MIVGVDEVGRGCWAGPVCVAAVILGDPIAGLTDSKKLTHKHRVAFAGKIRNSAKAIGIGWVSASAIDKHGISMALKWAAQNALAQITYPFEEIILDGKHNYLHDNRVTTIIKADLLVPSVSAASIVAKVARDHYMHMLHPRFEAYQFHRHVGYGTPLHRKLVTEHGPSKIHRLSYEPLKTLFGTAEKVSQPVTKKARQVRGAVAKTNGQRAENAAELFLQSKGYEIIARNWKTKLCEIDIIARQGNRVVFTEVKYRANDQQGKGMEYITPAKQRQMRFAAELWVQKQRWPGDYDLAALEVAGPGFSVTSWLNRI